MQAWSEGGYSDDLIVASCCGEHRLRILCPPSAIFPQPLEGDVSWGRYWNYLRRQLFVMDTYVSAHNRRVNHCMLLLHPLLSWGFVIPTGAGGPPFLRPQMLTVMIPRTYHRDLATSLDEP